MSDTAETEPVATARKFKKKFNGFKRNNNSLTISKDKDLVIKAQDLQKILFYLKSQADQEQKLSSFNWEKLTKALNSFAFEIEKSNKAEWQRFKDEQKRFREEKKNWQQQNKVWRTEKWLLIINAVLSGFSLILQVAKMFWK